MPVVAANGQSISFLNPAGRQVIRENDLEAVDARSRALPARLVVLGRALVIQVNTAHAAYPVRIDPLIQQGEKLTGDEPPGDSWFGASVALSADGNTAVVGAPQAEGGAGRAYIFVRSGATWVQQGPALVGVGAQSEITTAGFGERVALSDDGNTALVAGPSDRFFMGAVWVFVRSGTAWSQQGTKLAISQENGQGECGLALALSGDGNTALIGCPDENAYYGGAWVLVRSGSDWVQQGERLVGADEAGRAYFGTSVALSDDGNTAAVGGWNDTEGLGAVWPFSRSGTAWTQQGDKLTGASEEGEGHFGQTLALSGNGTSLLAGGSADGGEAGAAWAFGWTGTEWVSQGDKLVPNDATPRSLFGSAIALSYAGDRAIISGLNDGETGAVWEFANSGSGWSQVGTKLTAGEPSHLALFGSGLALSCSAGVALIGASEENGQAGAVWPFSASGLQVETCTLPSGSRGVPYSQQIVAGGNTKPLRWSKLAALPKGLKLKASGLISGTPSRKLTPGRYTVNVQVKERHGQSATASLELTIS